MAALRRLLSLSLLVLVGVVFYACSGSGPATMEIVTDPADLKAGKALLLPEGVVKLSEFKVPAGAVVAGAGFDKTIVDAEGKDVAFVIDGGNPSGTGIVICDLTIRNAGSAGIRVSNTNAVSITGVRITGPVVGISVSDARTVTITNCIISHGNAGVTMKNVTDSVVVNNTIARLGSTCLGLSNVTNTAVFNNIFADTSTAVIVGGKSEGLVIDYNLYACFAVGKIDGQIGRPWLETWRTLSGYDKHSVATGVVFADPDNGDFTPVSMLSWQPGVATTSNWGMTKLAGWSAPKKDIAGTSRDGRVDLGAIEVPRNDAAYATDGKFTIQSDEGTKSAGVFTPEGKLVRYLFHDLPLAAGGYDFHLPGQTQLGEAIPAGKYEIRVVEADLGVEYRGFTGNLGTGNNKIDASSLHLSYLAWSSDGQLLLGNGWSEKHMNLVKMDPATGKGLWAFKGAANNFGVAPDGKGTVYLVRRTSKWTDPADFQITRVNEKDGLPILDEHQKASVIFEGLTPSINLDGAAFLNGRIYISDPDANQLLVIDAATMKPLPAIPLAATHGAPHSVAADPKRNLLWAISDYKIVALADDGTIKHQHAWEAVLPVAVAVAGDTMAVANADDGRVEIYTIADPAVRPTLQRTIGTGDGPFGPWQADRFTFRANPHSTSTKCNLALKPDGTLAVHGPAFAQLSVFDPNGKPIHHAVAHFGNFPIFPHWKSDAKLIFENSGRMSFFIDTEKNTTSMDAYWAVPQSTDCFFGAYEVDGKRFGVFRHKAASTGRGTELMICRYEGYTAVPVLLYSQTAGETPTWVVRHADDNGHIDLETDGTPVEFPGLPVSRWISVCANGDIISTGSLQLGMRWKFMGLDERGIPKYDVSPEHAVKRADAQVTNPYNFEKKTGLRQSETLLMPGDQGTAVCLVLNDTLQGMGFSNSGATDIARFAPDGSLIWLRPMNEVAPIQGLKPLGTHMMTSYGHEAWWMLITNDGLGMGSFGTPAAFNWEGYWVDHPDQTNAFIGKDGRTHIVAGDYMNNMLHWLTVTGEEKTKHAVFPLTIDDAKATQLAARPAQAYQATPKPPPSQLVVKKLDKPLPIDGDLAKWRQAVPAPQVLVTPASSSGITSSADLSAVIRVAYHGDTLYFQFLVFDDAIAQHQEADKFYMQDSIQMTFNGFLGGFAFNGATLADGTQYLFRNRFFDKNMNLVLDPELAPRKFVILDNAKDVTERKYIESIYGEDLSECYVRLYEFALPINEKTYAGDLKALERMKLQSGMKFWIGFMLNDVDTIGVDEQPLAVWPSTYGMFATEDKGATAVLE